MRCVQGHHLLHTGQSERGFAVQRRNAAAQHGRHAHGGKQQLRQAHVHAKARAAIGFGNQVRARGRCAYQFPVLAVFGRHFGRCAGGGGLGQLAIVGRRAGGVLHAPGGDCDF